ncbi:right-handed parallel beta-helix repeat-containing protein [Halomarina oriensis]|uniref:right-handed parallel beta-helix repeat-containing protein n=1 Tax=Halomarina oriensis TaxID=671145 RepID=UPI001303000F
MIRFDGPSPGGWQVDSGVVLENSAFWTVRNLRIRNSRHLGLRLTGTGTHDTLVSNVETSGNYLSGIGVYEGASNNLLSDVWAHDNFDRDNGGDDADGIQFGAADGNVVRRAVCYGNSDDGIDLWESRDVLVEDCWCWQNGRGKTGNGNGFKLGGGERSSGGQTVRWNVAFANRAAGFDQNGADVPMRVYNNTAVANAAAYVFYDVPHDLKNNIAFGGSVDVNDAVRDAHNTWSLDITDPGFVSRRPRDEAFLRLLPTSPCVDAGADVGLEYAGPRPDLGAFEFIPRSPTTTG